MTSCVHVRVSECECVEVSGSMGVLEDKRVCHALLPLLVQTRHLSGSAFRNFHTCRLGEPEQA